jgi:hypothetical protein
MTVQELQRLLSTLPPTMPVMIPGYEGGYDDIKNHEVVGMNLDRNVDWWYGRHELSDDAPPDTTALILY